MTAEQFIRQHIWAWITIVDAIKRVELYRKCLEVSRQESWIDAQSVRAGSLSLNVMEKYGNVRYLCLRQPAKEKLVDEYLGETILAAGLDGTDQLNCLALFHDQVLLKTHLEIGIWVSLCADLNWNLDRA